jgi:hypothetical protein
MLNRIRLWANANYAGRGTSISVMSMVFTIIMLAFASLLYANELYERAAIVAALAIGPVFVSVARCVLLHDTMRHRNCHCGDSCNQSDRGETNQHG